MKKHLLLLNVLILVALTTFAQNGFTTYPLPSALTSTRNCLKMDPLGNKWIGFFKWGASKFDGTNWTTYDTLNSGIAANRVYDIAFGPSNTIWFATTKGLSKFDGSTWTNYKTSNSGLPNDIVLCVYVDNTDIWVGTQSGLAKFDGSTWMTYTTANSGLVNNKILCINKDQSNKFWIGTPTGLCVKSGSNWITYNEINSNFVSDQVNTIFVDNGSVWIGTKTSSIFKFENNVFHPLHSLYYNTAFNWSMSIYTIYTISKGPQGGILINSFYEILPDQIHQYTIPAGINSYFHAYDSTTGLVWCIPHSGFGTGNVIYSFNYQNFTGTTLLPQLPNGFNTLDINEVRAGLMNRGDMFWDVFGNGSARYEVPKYSGRNAAFASALWIGGMDNGGNLHEAAMTYRQAGVDFWTGPLDTLSGTTDSITSASFDKIWKIDQLNIEEFKTMFANGSVQNNSYTVSPDIINWPATGAGNYTRNMAPFVDVNGDGLYNPLSDGDYPKITGNQMCYWIFNDNLAAHTETGGTPLKIEIHASAYAFTCPQIADSLKALNYTTFYNFEIYNRSANNYHNTYLANWDDADLGSYTDDYVGCNPSNNYGFEYNGTAVDGFGTLGSYGPYPPMISTVILNGPPAEANDSIDNNNNGVIDETGEKNLMTSFLYYFNDNSVHGNTTTASDYYNYSSSRWRDSTHITYGGLGWGGTSPTNFMFDGIPSGSGWNEVSSPEDKRFVLGCGPFNLNAGAHVSFNYALVWTRDTTSFYSVGNLYNQNLADVKKVQQWYSTDMYPSCYDVQTGINSVEKNNNSLSIFPNPANTQLTLDYTGQSKFSKLDIYDSTGQLIVSFNYLNSRQTIDISDFSDGLYLVKISDGKNSSVQRFVKQ